MCTVVIDVAEPGGSRLLAVRDEDPEREWDSLGPWWPQQYPGVIGIRDRRAGGAWLAIDRDAHRLAVLLNRADVLDLPEDEVRSRGSLALRQVAPAYGDHRVGIFTVPIFLTNAGSRPDDAEAMHG